MTVPLLLGPVFLAIYSGVASGLVTWGLEEIFGDDPESGTLKSAQLFGEYVDKLVKSSREDNPSWYDEALGENMKGAYWALEQSKVAVNSEGKEIAKEHLDWQESEYYNKSLKDLLDAVDAKYGYDSEEYNDVFQYYINEKDIESIQYDLKRAINRFEENAENQSDQESYSNSFSCVSGQIFQSMLNQIEHAASSLKTIELCLARSCGKNTPAAFDGQEAAGGSEGGPEGGGLTPTAYTPETNGPTLIPASFSFPSVTNTADDGGLYQFVADRKQQLDALEKRLQSAGMSLTTIPQAVEILEQIDMVLNGAPTAGVSPESAMETLGDLFRELQSLGADALGAEAPLKGVEAAAESATAAVKNTNDEAEKTPGILSTIGSMAADSLGSIGKQFIEMAKDGDISWETLRSSAYDALSSIVEYVAKSGLEELFGEGSTSGASGGTGSSDGGSGSFASTLLDGAGELISGALSWATDWLFSAQGNAFGLGGGVEAYALGGIVSKPTLFRHASGLGLMGEAGPEAIMPLRRLGNGSLGVQASGLGGDGGGGGGTTVQIIDQRSNSSAAAAQVSETTGPDGQRLMQVLIRDEVNKQMRSGGLDKAMTDTYGVRRTGTRR